MTQEDAVARYAAEQGGQETTETTETTETAETTEEEVETTETTSEETTETTETTQAAAPDPFYKSLGYEDEDGVVASLNEYRALQERTSALQEREAAIAQKEQLISKFESPYSHDVVGKLDQAMAKLGITDLSLVSQLVSTTAESVNGDPVTAIVIAKILDNPSLIGDGITFKDLMDVERAKLEERGIDMEDKTSIKYKELVIDSKGALAKINNFQESLKDVKGKFTFAQENEQQVAQRFNENVAKLTPRVEELLKGGKRSFEVEGTKFDLALSKEQQDSIRQSATNLAVQRGYDLSTVEGVKALNTLVDAMAKGALVSTGEYEKALYKAVCGKVKEETLLERSQGKPDPRAKPSGAGTAKGKTDTEMYFEQQLAKAEGKI